MFYMVFPQKCFNKSYDEDDETKRHILDEI